MDHGEREQNERRPRVVIVIAPHRTLLAPALTSTSRAAVPSVLEPVMMQFWSAVRSVKAKISLPGSSVHQSPLYLKEFTRKSQMYTPFKFALVRNRSGRDVTRIQATIGVLPTSALLRQGDYFMLRSTLRPNNYRSNQLSPALPRCRHPTVRMSN